MLNITSSFHLSPSFSLFLSTAHILFTKNYNYFLTSVLSYISMWDSTKPLNFLLCLMYFSFSRESIWLGWKSPCTMLFSKTSYHNIMISQERPDFIQLLMSVSQSCIQTITAHGMQSWQKLYFYSTIFIKTIV